MSAAQYETLLTPDAISLLKALHEQDIGFCCQSFKPQQIAGISQCAVVQTERGQKEISAARVREVESQLAGAQNSLKAERLLLQQASIPLKLSLVPALLFLSPASCYGGCNRP